MREWASLNGRLMPADEAQISVFDSGFMQGVGLFETMRAYGERVFRLDQHLERLVNSARRLGWSILPALEELRTNVMQVVRATPQQDVSVRLTVTTGSLRSSAQDPPQLTMVATATPGTKYPEELYTKGVAVVISEYRQSRFDPTAGHKTNSYFARLASLRAAHAKQTFEALWFTPEHNLAEGAISSVFLVQDGQLLTPPLHTPVLPGITRAVVIDLAVAQDIPVREQPLTVDDLLNADEVFLTGSLMEVMPVVLIEREPVGLEKPGEVTQELALAYKRLVIEECGDE
ncbi:MAG: aminotransferase class IV [Planctomycetes bacterium]|nr:aminotransferase class IV [Planctomycetota bacterium]